MKDYGKELILDLHNCDPYLFTRKSIREYFKEVCILINMERCKLTWWDDLHTPEAEKETESHLVGTSAVQFIKTSSIVIHTLDILRKAYINLFSCKDFLSADVVYFSESWFNGKVVNNITIRRI
jgi:S-adenosylmethionine/arginine decarboxylase-like enzyme